MDTMFSFNGNGMNNHFMSDEEIMSVCPNAFKTTPTNPNVSDKYVQASTIDVIRDMRNLGWYPVQAKQCRNFITVCFSGKQASILSISSVKHDLLIFQIPLAWCNNKTGSFAAEIVGKEQLCLRTEWFDPDRNSR